MIKFPFRAWAEHYMKTDLQEKTDKYLFIVSNQDLWMQIVTNNFRSLCLSDEADITEFIGYMDEIQFRGTHRSDYMYVLCCDTAKANKKLKEYIEADGILKLHEGWQIFRGKEYLKNSEHNQELVEILQSVVKRYEPEEVQLFLDDFHFMKDRTSGEAGATGVFDFAIFEHIKRHYNIFVCGNPYIYSSGVYVPDYQGTKLKKIIRGYLYPKFRKSRTINQVYDLIIQADELQKDFSELNCHPKSYINFQDYMLDVETMQEIPHSPDFFSINQIPHKWQDVKRADESKEIEKFFDFIFSSDDDRKMLLEYAGLCLTVDTRQQRFLTLCGLGGTGKSVLIRLLEAAAGAKNVSNVAMQDLSKRFSTSLLVAKTLNSCADLSVEALEDSSTMKKLIGEDKLMAESKGQNAFMFRNYSKLLFSTNALPVVTAERTNGFFRRMLILKMDKQPNKPDIELADRLLSELHYFIKLSVQALHEMYQRGIITISENSKAAVLQMRKDSDVIEAWISERCTVKADLKMERAAAFENFKEYCENEERQSLTRNGFYKGLRQKNFSETTDSRGKRYFIGISNEKSAVKTAVDNEFMTVTDEQLAELPFT